MIKYKTKNTFHDKIMDWVWHNLQNTTWLFRLIINSINLNIAKNFLFLYITLCIFYNSMKLEHISNLWNENIHQGYKSI
jgi:hypothetical protein